MQLMPTELKNLILTKQKTEFKHVYKIFFSRSDNENFKLHPGFINISSL